MEYKDLLPKIFKRLKRYRLRICDGIRASFIRGLNKWPCQNIKYLMVGSESSGTTAISNLLFQEVPGIRFLDEGEEQWVWDVYMQVYQGKKTIRQYPRLQLFDAIKVPGFATIIPEFLAEFPNTAVIYIVRDPRDFVNSAIKTWRIQKVEDLARISWVRENWLNIPNTDPVERLAMRWKMYLNSAMAAKNVVFVRYEDFWVDKVLFIEKLAVKVGLPFNRTRVEVLCERQLCKPSVRNYSPKGPGGWKNSILVVKHIKKIEDICGEEMSIWGYKFF